MLFDMKVYFSVQLNEFFIIIVFRFLLLTGIKQKYIYINHKEDNNDISIEKNINITLTNSISML
jgi:hypothetical protein